MKSCRKSSKNEACRYYVPGGKFNHESPPMCRNFARRLDGAEVAIGCNQWTEPASADEVFIQDILGDPKLSDIQKYSAIYPEYIVSQVNGFGTTIVKMENKNDPEDIKFIFGNPIEHEIVNQFKIEDLSIKEKHLERIPEKTVYYDHDNLYWEIAYAYNNDIPMSMWGHTGTGKSELIKQFAAIIGAPVYRVNFNGMTTTDDIIGKLLPGPDGSIIFQDGGVTECVRHGGILLLEEMNACSQEVLFGMHGLLDGFGALVLIEKDNEIVKKHVDCRIFATMNPSEFVFLYPGTKDLSQAFASRWPIFRYVDFLPEKLEEKLLKESNPTIDLKDIKQMVKVGTLCRRMMKEGKLNFVFSTRVLKNWARLTNRFGMITAAELAFLGHMDSNSRNIVITEVLDVATSLDVSELKVKYVRQAG